MLIKGDMLGDKYGTSMDYENNCRVHGSAINMKEY